MGDTVYVDALVREALAAEVTEGLERNPGSRRLAERDLEDYGMWPEDVARTTLGWRCGSEAGAQVAPDDHSPG